MLIIKLKLKEFEFNYSYEVNQIVLGFIQFEYISVESERINLNKISLDPVFARLL